MSRLVLAHESRHSASWLIFDVGQKSMTSLRYIAVEWRHEHAGEPVRIYSEIDARGWEQRKVEVFRDGRKFFADEHTHSGDTRLGEEVIPPLVEIAADPQFAPQEITKEAFERVWLEAKAS